MANLKFFQNAFERLGNNGNVLNNIEQNTRTSSESVAVGGDLYEKVSELTQAIVDFKDGKGVGAGGGIQNAMAIALISPSMEPLGKGLQFVVDAVNNLQDTGEEVKAKMEGLAAGITLLGDVGKSILKFAGFMVLATPLLMIAAVASPLIGVSLFALTLAIDLSTRKLDEEKMKKVAMLGDLGKAILILFGTLALVSFVVPLAMKALIPTLVVVGAFALLTAILPTKKIRTLEKFGDGLIKVSLGILGMFGALAIAGLIAAPALKGAIVAGIVIGILALSFALLEKTGATETMEDGAKGLLFAAGAILGLGVALALFNIITPPFGVLLNIALVVGAVGLMFGVVGIFESQIMKGAKALAWAALSIVVLGVALLFFTKVVAANIGGQDLAASFGPLVLIGLIAVGFAAAGLAESFIKKGAIALLLAGVSLIIIGAGVTIIKKALGDSPFMTIGTTMALIAGLGVVFGVAGAGPIPAFIALGAGALIVGGIALITIGAGLSIMGKVLKDKAKTEALKNDLAPTLKAVTKGFMMWPWESAGIIMGAGALTLAGVALISIGTGIKKFSELISSGVDLPEVATNVSKMIGTLAIPFQLIGGGGTINVMHPITGKKEDVTFGGSTGGFLGLGSSNPVSDGIRAVMNMGKALSGIAGGMQDMANLKFPTGFDNNGKPTGYETITGKTFEAVLKNTIKMVGALAVPFAMIGKGGELILEDGTKVDLGKPAAGGLMGFLTGGGDVQKGIKAVMNMGSALSNIAGGVQDMALLKFPTEFDKDGKPTKYINFDENAAAQVTANTEKLVEALSGTFAKIGGGENAQTSWWGGKSTIEKGIEIVAGIGEPLLNLAKGVEAMANLKFPIYDKNGKITGYTAISDVDSLEQKVGDNTRKLIQALTNTITTIGKDNPDATSSWWQGSKPFEDGIEIISMIGEPYKILGESVKEIIDIVSDLDSAAFATKIKDIVGVFTAGGVMSSEESNIKDRIDLVTATGLTYDKLGKAMTLTKESMPGITSSINEMDLEKLVESRKMFEALAVLGEGGEPADILAQMGESLEEALENLASLLAEFKGSVEEGVAAQSEATGGLTGAIQSMNPFSRGGGSSSASSDNGDVVAAVENLKSALISQGIKIKKSNSFFS